MLHILDNMLKSINYWKKEGYIASPIPNLSYLADEYDAAFNFVDRSASYMDERMFGWVWNKRNSCRLSNK